MTPERLYEKADQVLLPALLPIGFARKQPGEYVRNVPGGFDRIMVSHGPGAKRNTHFCVLVSPYYDQQEQLLGELLPLQEEDRGFPCGPYLNPVAVSSRAKYWGYRTEDAMASSLEHVLVCLRNAGIPWLEKLRDPKVFADNVDSTAAISAAIAHEMAGNAELARDAYREMYRRYLLCISEFGEESTLKENGRAFVFVCAKLGVDEERRRAFEDRLSYHPDIEPI